MFIVTATWYCVDDHKVVKDYRLAAASSWAALGALLDEYYGIDLIEYNATAIGCDCANGVVIDLNEDIAAKIKELNS